MLKEEEWITISDLLCDLYSEHDLNSLVKKIMTCLRILVPYSCGYCILTDEENEIRPDSSYFTGMDEAAQKLYLNKYYDKDYLKILYDITHETRVYRDTDILDDSVRKNTEIFRGFMKPHDIPYGCGIMLIKKHRLIGIINLFKSSSMGDFTEKDIFILDVLKKHLRNMFINSDAFENMTEAGR